KTKLLFDAALPEEDSSFSDLQTVSPLQKKPASINTKSTTSHESTKSNKELSSPIQKDQTMSEEEDMLPFKKKSSPNESMSIWYQPRAFKKKTIMSVLYLGHDIVVGRESLSECDDNKMVKLSGLKIKQAKEILKTMRKKYNKESDHTLFQAFYEKAKLLFDAALPEEDPSFSYLQTVSPLQKKPASINTQSTTSHESTKSNKELSSPIQKDQTMSEEEDMLPFKKKSSPNESMSIWYQPRAFKKKTIMSVLYLGHDIVVGRESLSECDDNKMVKLSGLKIKQAKEILKTMRKKYNKESDHTLFQAFYEKAKLLFDAALPEEDPSFSYLQTVSPLQKKPASINTQSTTSHESTKSNKELSSPIQKDQTMSEEEDMLPLKKKSSSNEN
uniref:Uncharacterized protein n=1 Tax=Clytia hemisphaerica TaxID=252671 RepID=A0A7M5X0H1_9CNID